MLVIVYQCSISLNYFFSSWVGSLQDKVFQSWRVLFFTQQSKFLSLLNGGFFFTFKDFVLINNTNFGLLNKRHLQQFKLLWVFHCKRIQTHWNILIKDILKFYFFLKWICVRKYAYVVIIRYFYLM